MYHILKKLARKKNPAQREFINYSKKHLGCHFGSWTICMHSRQQPDCKEPLSYTIYWNIAEVYSYLRRLIESVQKPVKDSSKISTFAYRQSAQILENKDQYRYVVT